MLNFDYHRDHVVASIIFDTGTRLKAPIRDIFRWKNYSFGMNVHVSKKSHAIIKRKLDRFFEFNKVNNNKLQETT